MLILELQLELVESAEERRRGRGKDFQLRRPEDEDESEDENVDDRLEREWVSWKSLSSQAGGAYIIVPHPTIERRKRRCTSQFSESLLLFCVLYVCSGRGGEQRQLTLGDPRNFRSSEHNFVFSSRSDRPA